MVVPMPTAGPHTAATIGLVKVLMPLKKLNTGASRLAGGALRKSPMPLPALKMVSWPWNTTARTASSASACASASAMAVYMAPVSEFFFSTRFRVMVITPALVSTRMSVMRVPVFLYAFKYTRRTLPHADAHGEHAVAQVIAVQRMDGGGRADGAGGTQRVTQRNGAAHRVDLGRVQPQRVHDRQRLGGKRFVEFDPVDVVLLQPGVAQRRRNGFNRADAHDLRRHAFGGKADEARQRLEAKLL